MSRRSEKVCPRCHYIRPEGIKDCACTYRMAALEEALQELAPNHPALQINKSIAATKQGRRGNRQ